MSSTSMVFRQNNLPARCWETTSGSTIAYSTLHNKCYFVILFLFKIYSTTINTICLGLLSLLSWVFGKESANSLMFWINFLKLCGWPHSRFNNDFNSFNFIDNRRTSHPAKVRTKKFNSNSQSYF